MRYARLLVALTVILSTVPGGVAADVIGSPVLDVSLSTDSVSPGDQTSLDLTVLNSGQVREGSNQNPALNDRVTTARGLVVAVDDEDSPIDVKSGQRAIGTLPEGATDVSFSMTVDEDAEPGTYEIPVTTRYRYTRIISEGVGGGEQQTLRTTETFDVTLEIEEDAQLQIRDVASSARVGSAGTAELTVENAGTATANGASLQVTSKNAGLTFGGSETASRTLGDFEPGERQTVDYRVTTDGTAATQPYSVEAVLQYKDSDGVDQTSETRTFAITPKPEQPFSISDVQSTLRVGEEGRLEGTITNDGDTAADSAVVRFATQRQTVNPVETEAPVGTLSPGESANFSFPIEITESADSGAKQYALTVQFRNEDGDSVTSDDIDVPTEVGPSIRKFGLETDGATVTPGQGTILNVTVTNNADQRYTDISANMFADSPMSVTDDEAIITALDPGESETVKFSVGAAGGALPTKNYPVSVDFQYDNADGDTQLSETYRIPVTVARPENGGGGPPILLIVGAILVIGIGVYVYRNRG